MKDEMFDLLTKMYNEMTSRFDGVDKRFDGVDKRFDGVDKRLDKVELDIVRLENKMDTNFKALYDGYMQNSEKISLIDMKVDELAAKVDRQAVEIRVIKGGRDIKAK